MTADVPARTNVATCSSSPPPPPPRRRPRHCQNRRPPLCCCCCYCCCVWGWSDPLWTWQHSTWKGRWRRLCLFLLTSSLTPPRAPSQNRGVQRHVSGLPGPPTPRASPSRWSPSPRRAHPPPALRASRSSRDPLAASSSASEPARPSSTGRGHAPGVAEGRTSALAAVGATSVPAGAP